MSDTKFDLNAEKQLLVLFDALTGKTVNIICRVPSTDEKIEYKGQIVDLVQKDKKLVYSYQLQIGEKLITGFEGNYFTIDDKPISSNPGDTQQNYDAAYMKHQIDLEAYNKLSSIDQGAIAKPEFNKCVYYPGWYAVLKAKRPEFIWQCVDYLYGSSVMVIKGEQLPFGKNSGS